MGYYTYYDLCVLNNDEVPEEDICRASRRLAEMLGEYDDTNTFYDDFGWLSYDERKWYNHAEDMTLLAQEFPNMLFMLHGIGEESEDHWNEYYYGTRHFAQGWHWDCAPAWTQVRTKPKEVLR